MTKLLAPPPATPSSASPPSLAQGTTADVSVTGTQVSGSGFYDPGAGFPNHISATVSCAGVTVNSVTYVSPTSITLNLTIAAGAATNPSCTITVTNPDGQMITSAAIFGVGKANGAGCGGAGECLSNFCVGGVCCNNACGACGTCSSGSCVNQLGPGSPACGGNQVCSGVSPTCPAGCGTNDALCAYGFFCQAGACAPSLPNGSACTRNAQCVSALCNGTQCVPNADWFANASSGNVSLSNNFGGNGYFATDSRLNGIQLASGMPLGGSPFNAGATVENVPEAVTLNDGKTYVFITSNDGFLYKVNAATMTAAQMRDLKRSGMTCNPPDVMQGSPTLQLAAFSNAAFKSAWGATRNLVYVITYYGCGETVANRVIAYDADDITAAAVWTFTGSASFPMDYGSEGCALDYATNRLFCGTNKPAASSQPTAWAFDTTTGARLWSVDVGAAVHTRPQLASGSTHVFVADMSAKLHALNTATGGQDWQLVVNAASGAFVANNVWAEWRVGAQPIVFVTDSAGILTAVTDAGASGSVKWRQFMTGAHAITPASVAPTMGLVFVGLDDGTMHQLDFASGNDLKTRLVLNANAATPGNLTAEPTFAIEGAATDINKLVVSTAGNFGTTTKQFPVPLP